MMMRFLGQLKRWAAELKAQVMTLWFSRAHPDTPIAAKVMAGFVVAYALSPIDLIPDFIPVLGLLDDLILLPLGIALCVRLIPADVFEDARRRAIDVEHRPANRIAAVVIVLIWIGLAVACGIWAWQKLN